jgi:CBS domain-containing protein
MKISEAMTRDVQLIEPDQEIREAARRMADLGIGALPVAENDRLIGMITDRDIAIRAVAEGRGPDTPVREVLSADVKYCFEDQTVEEVARNMGDIQVRRLPVLNRDKRLVGIVSLGDLSLEADEPAAGALRGVSRAGGQHTQSDVTTPTR